MSTDRQKPGEKPIKPGEWKETGPRGGKVDNPKQVTIEEGDSKMPPTSEPGNQWERQGPPKP